MRRRKRATRKYLVKEYRLTPAQIDELTQRQIKELYLSTDADDEDDAPVKTTPGPKPSRGDTVSKLAKLLGRSEKSIREGLKWSADKN